LPKAFDKLVAFVALFEGRIRIEAARGAKVGTQRAVLGALIARANETGEVPPGLAPRTQDMVAMLGVSDRSARAAIAALRSQGLIATVDRPGKPRGFNLLLTFDRETPCKNDSPGEFAGGLTDGLDETPPAKMIALAKTPVVNGVTTCKSATPGEFAGGAKAQPLANLQGVSEDGASEAKRRSVARTVLSPSNAVGWEIWEILVGSSTIRAAEDADQKPKPGSLARMAKGIADRIARGDTSLETAKRAIDAISSEVGAESPKLPTMEELSQLFSRHLRTIRRGNGIGQEQP